MTDRTASHRLRMPHRRPRSVAALVASFLALALAVSPVVACSATADVADVASGPTAVHSDSSTRVLGVASGRCLDVVGASTAERASLNLFDCSTSSNQQWTLTPAGELRIYGGTRCLDVAAHGMVPGSRVQIFGCNGGANQRWTLAADRTIRGVESGLCLDVLYAATANGSPISVWSCSGQGNQQWTVSGAGADTQPPTVPGSARVSDLRCDAVTFAWNASTDTVGVAFYDLYHDGQLMTSVSGMTLSARLAVVAGVSWGLYVNARDAAGNVSQASATVPISPPFCQGDTTAPSAPAGLSTAVGGTSVTLRWAASTDNVGVRAYDVYRNDAKVGSTNGTADSPPATSYVDSGLTAATSYRYRVIARDAQGNISPSSSSVSATTGSGCTNPVCEVTQVTTDSDIPWGLVTLPDGSVLYNRRDAHTIVRLNPATGAKATVGTVPNVESTVGEGGLMGLAISTNFASDRWVYIMHTSPSDNRIVRIKLIGDRLDTATEQVLLSGILRNKYHDGGRLRFGPDGKLYASTGDAQNGNNSQNTANLSGKVLRLNPDGSVPADNPFGNAVWSYGHRNPQGLAFDSQGRLWEQEFGNSVMDETNLIVRGGNYGWPACEGTSGTCATAGYRAPARTYPTTEASCSGIAIVRDVLYTACGRGQRLYRQTISGSSLTNQTQYFVGTFGRLRTVEPAPDGGLWLTTTNQGDKDSTPNNSAEKILHIALG